MALLLFQGAVVKQMNLAAAGDARLHQDERAVGVDRQRGGFLGEILVFRIRAANADGDLHQNALAPATRSRA